jgi:hypothetical protein
MLKKSQCTHIFGSTAWSASPIGRGTNSPSLDTSALKALPDKGCGVNLKAHPAERLLERLLGGLHAAVAHRHGVGDDQEA